MVREILCSDIHFVRYALLRITIFESSSIDKIMRRLGMFDSDSFASGVEP